MSFSILSLLILMALHASPSLSDQSTVSAYADSLYAGKHYLQAIEAYTKLMDGENVDYALYKRGMAKTELARFCVSAYQFDKYPENYRKRYGDKYETYLIWLKYIEEHPGDFGYFEPGALHVYHGADFRTVISDYPESEYVDDSAYAILLKSHYRDWEGEYSEMLPYIRRCKTFLDSYPESELCDKVVDLCIGDYSDIIEYSWELADSLKTHYQKELQDFKKLWKK
ncbi:hypothetical protein ACFL47_03295 [Candidatus Latescibacterota bacterium]